MKRREKTLTLIKEYLENRKDSFTKNKLDLSTRDDPKVELKQLCVVDFNRSRYLRKIRTSTLPSDAATHPMTP